VQSGAERFAGGENRRDLTRGAGSGRWQHLPWPVDRATATHRRSRFQYCHHGYQEILTDPSYARQIVTLTYPTPATPHDARGHESGQVYAAGLVIRDLSIATSSWRAESTLAEFLQRSRTVAIAGIDTRRSRDAAREWRAGRLHHDRRKARRGGAIARDALSGLKAWIWPRW